ncbi:MAG: VOC family protein, partial [Pseudomonadota bacterium]
VWLAEQAGVAALPTLPSLRGIEFIEFAVDEAARAELGAFLAPLGFARTGVHRSKQVELWRSGGANIVLNAEPDSAASERFEQHGPSACAMALRVDDAARTASRAEALLCSVWQERVGVGERTIPAVRAPDGTLVYLVEEGGRAIWEDDFHLDPAPAPRLGVTGIDHVAQALAPGFLESFALFYRAVFGLEPESLFELPDPYGLVRSRAFTGGNGTVRLPLNVSESGRTGTGRFVSALAGAGVHHIAFSVDDVAAAVDAAGSEALLDIPPNYYEDIAARFGLDGATVAALRARHLLFDAAAEGEFRHAYTDAFRDRFFFEICDRRAGYAGFGAANAGVRMAAQRRATPATRMAAPPPR